MEFFFASVIIQTDHSAIFNIMKQFSITFTSSTMRMKVCLVKFSRFFQQFCLVVYHKLRKKYIVLDTLSMLATANRARYNHHYSKLNALLTYQAILVEISSDLVKRIFDSYLAND